VLNPLNLIHEFGLVEADLVKIEHLKSFAAAIKEYDVNPNFKSNALKADTTELSYDIKTLKLELSSTNIEELLESVHAFATSNIMFDIFLEEQGGKYFYQKKNFEVTNEMIENNEYPAVEEWLNAQDLDYSKSFSFKPSTLYQYCFLNLNDNSLIGVAVGYLSTVAFKSINTEVKQAETLVFKREISFEFNFVPREIS